MADNNNKIEIISFLKDSSSFIRDALLTLILAICVINPSSIKSFLDKSGLSELEAFGIKVSLKEEKEKIATAQEKVSAQIFNAPKTQTDTPVEALNKPVDEDFKQAILTAERIAPQILPNSGWVFLGRVNNNKSQWADTSSTTTANWPITRDSVITIKDDVYVRAITEDKWHSLAPISSVAKVGDELKVVDLEYSSAKVGGFYVWAKVAIIK